MKTIFHCPEAPRLKGDIFCRSEPCSQLERCSFCDEGFEHVDEPEDPRAEFSLDLADTEALLQLVGLWGQGIEGVIFPKGVPKVMQGILVALNRAGYLDKFTTPLIDEGGPGTDLPRRISLGVSDDDLIVLLIRFRDLLEYALENSFLINWGPVSSDHMSP